MSEYESVSEWFYETTMESLDLIEKHLERAKRWEKMLWLIIGALTAIVLHSWGIW